MNSSPNIAVLLATHNGTAYLEEQLRSVLAQTGVSVHVFVSDDASTDGTEELATSISKASRNVSVLPPGHFGSAVANFYRLIREVPADGFDAVAFCDQDDIWEPWKLQHHFAILTGSESPAAAVSSNVKAFDTDGHEWIVNKSQQQQLADFMFESGGPGSTFLLSPDTYDFVRTQLLDPTSPASQVRAHDWCIYALVRASGRRWVIDAAPSVRYRQHQNNVLGANDGLRQYLSRLTEFINRNFRRNVVNVLTACHSVASAEMLPLIDWTLSRTATLNPIDRIRLARQASQFRRRCRDQVILALAILTGLW
mgnify:CR=1 FL=1